MGASCRRFNPVTTPRRALYPSSLVCPPRFKSAVVGASVILPSVHTDAEPCLLMLRLSPQGPSPLLNGSLTSEPAPPAMYVS
jgi:hypothetical protein